MPNWLGQGDLWSFLSRIVSENNPLVCYEIVLLTEISFHLLVLISAIGMKSLLILLTGFGSLVYPEFELLSTLFQKLISFFFFFLCVSNSWEIFEPASVSFEVCLRRLSKFFHPSLYDKRKFGLRESKQTYLLFLLLKTDWNNNSLYCQETIDNYLAYREGMFVGCLIRWHLTFSKNISRFLLSLIIKQERHVSDPAREQ